MRTRPWIAALALVPLAVLGAAPAQAAGDRDVGRITYGRYAAATDTVSLWSADLDGTDQELLVAGPTSFSDWSPDGSLVAFDFADDTGVHIATVPAAGGPVTVLTTAPGVQESPKWSPDGRWITYGAFDPAQEVFSTSVWVMRSDGSDARRVTDDGFDVEPVFSPDGTRIAFGRITGEVPEGQLEALYTVRVDGSGLREVIPPLAGLEHPDWSPDGRRLTVNIGPEYPDARNSGSILTVRPDGRSLRVLRAGTDRLVFYKAVWSPDGRRLLTGCFDREAGVERLCTMTASGARVRTVPDVVGVNFPAWGVQATPGRGR